MVRQGQIVTIYDDGRPRNVGVGAVSSCDPSHLLIYHSQERVGSGRDKTL